MSTPAPEDEMTIEIAYSAIDKFQTELSGLRSLIARIDHIIPGYVSAQARLIELEKAHEQITNTLRLVMKSHQRNMAIMGSVLGPEPEAAQPTDSPKPDFTISVSNRTTR